MIVAVVIAVLAGGAVLALVVLTAIGSRQRGRARLSALAEGLFFPFAWVRWYVEDAPHQTSPARQSQATGASRSSPAPPST